MALNVDQFMKFMGFRFFSSVIELPTLISSMVVSKITIQGVYAKVHTHSMLQNCVTVFFT